MSGGTAVAKGWASRRWVGWVQRASPGEVRHAAVVVVVTLIGVVLRLVWALRIGTIPTSDFAGYQANATLVYHYQNAPAITMQGAGYPFILGLVYRLAGSNDLLVGKLFNVALSSATLVLCYAIFSRLTTSSFRRYVAYAGVAILPNYIAYTSVLGTETLFTTLFATTVLLQLLNLDWRVRAPLLGLVVGLGTLTKPYFLVYPAVFALTDWLHTKDLARVLRTAVVACATMLVVIAPVTYWNYLELHRFVLNTYNAGIDLFINSNSDNYIGGWMPLSDIHISPAFRDQLLQHGMVYPDIPQDQRFAAVEPLFRAQAESYIIHHPVHYLYLAFLRVDNLYFSGAADIRSLALAGVVDSWPTGSGPLSAFSRLADAMVSLLSASALLVVVVGLRQIVAVVARRGAVLPPHLAVPVLNILFFTAVFSATEGQPRYAFPMLFLSVFCVAYLADCVRQAVRRDSSDSGSPSAARIEEADTLVLAAQARPQPSTSVPVATTWSSRRLPAPGGT